MADRTEKHSDIVIAGGAYVGLSLAVAIKSAAPQLAVTVIDASQKGAWKNDPRASAVAAAAIRMLDKLDCWQSVLPDSEPIREMIITDSRKSDPVRPVFLTFTGDVRPGEPFACMVENRHLNARLHARAAELGVTVLEETRVEDFSEQAGHMRITLDNGGIYNASLLVGADGVRSQTRDIAGIKTMYWPYNQMGIVCTVHHERPHNGQAIEHFLPAGPFAILPLKGNRSLLVWNEDEAETARLMAADDMVFEAGIEQRFGRHLGALRLEGPRGAYPFGLRLARDFVRPRFALAGDAAHGIHPISGQGLNLGFRDVAALAQVVVEAARLGLDIGALNVLEHYQRWRRFETVRMGVTTDILNRMFSNDIPLLRTARDIGLGLVDRMPRLKDYFIQEAAGLSKQSPHLLLGEAI